ncbi:MAG: hypothetical protein ACKVOR_12125 [Flavobacteriales bacterium]
MSKLTTLLFIMVICATTSVAQPTRKDLDGKYFHLKGTVYEVDMFAAASKAAADVEVLVYQDSEIFVAFNTASRGLYEFYLPVGHEYELVFGGKEFVNKKVYVDTRLVPEEKKPQVFDLDMGLFRPLDGQEFPVLQEAFVQVGYDEELAKLAANLEYTEEKAAMLDKQFKKIKKQLDKTK